MDLSLLFSNETTQIVISVLLAAFGGIARLLSQKEKISMRMSTVLSCCFVSSFLGVLAYFTVGYLNLAINIVYITAGICGWLGPQVINVFANIILQSAGLNLQMINEQQLMLKDSKFIDETVHPPLTDRREKIKYQFEEPVGLIEPLEEQFSYELPEEPVGWLEPLEEPNIMIEEAAEPATAIEAPLKKPRRSKKPIPQTLS